ncbi:MAG: hypothetical protein EOO40_08760 [Deltaproteobacteria bacterium]|nr:MAG: hypothetical protein EOO40_08760 [Deltaproteobacteria bacterium]
MGLRTFNVVGPCEGATCSLDDVVDWVQSAGYRVERVAPYTQWFERFTGALANLEPARQAASPWPILHQWQRPQKMGVGVVNNARFRAAVRSDVALPLLPRLDESFMHQCLRHMQHLGMINRQGDPHAS